MLDNVPMCRAKPSSADFAYYLLACLHACAHTMLQLRERSDDDCRVTHLAHQLAATQKWMQRPGRSEELLVAALEPLLKVPPSGIAQVQLQPYIQDTC